MKVKCDYCGKDFEKEPRRVNESNSRGWKHYCSKECQAKAKTTKIKCKCAFCGAEIEKLPSEIKNSKYGNVFCNKKCACSYNNSHFRSGENNPNWQGGNGTGKSSIYGKLAFKNYEHKCVLCGFNISQALQVHHIDCNRKNNVLDNLIILCANCHCLVHYGNVEITEEVKKKRVLINNE